MIQCWCAILVCSPEAGNIHALSGHCTALLSVNVTHICSVTLKKPLQIKMWDGKIDGMFF